MDKKIRFLIHVVCCVFLPFSLIAQEISLSEVWTFENSSYAPCKELFSGHNDTVVGRLCKSSGAGAGNVAGYFTYEVETGKGTIHAPLSEAQVTSALQSLVSSSELREVSFRAQGFSAIGDTKYAISSDGFSLLQSSISNQTDPTVFYTFPENNATFIGSPPVVLGSDGYRYAAAKRELPNFEGCQTFLLRFLPSGAFSETPIGGPSYEPSCTVGQKISSYDVYDNYLFASARNFYAFSTFAPESHTLLTLPIFGQGFRTLDQTRPQYTPPEQYTGVKLLRDGRLWSLRGAFTEPHKGYGVLMARNPITGGTISTLTFDATEGVPQSDFIVTSSSRTFFLTASWIGAVPDQFHLYEVLPPVPQAANVLGFTLVNAETGEELLEYRNLKGRVVIPLSSLPAPKLGIKAVVDSPSAKSVVFGLRDNPRFKIDDEAPFSLFGTQTTPYFAWTPQRGTYPLTATAYTRANGGGSAGKSETLTLVFTQQ